MLKKLGLKVMSATYLQMVQQKNTVSMSIERVEKRQEISKNVNNKITIKRKNRPVSHVFCSRAINVLYLIGQMFKLT